MTRDDEKPAEETTTAPIDDSDLRAVVTRQQDLIEKLIATVGLHQRQLNGTVDKLPRPPSRRPHPAPAAAGHGPYTFHLIDALTQKVCEGGRTVNVARQRRWSGLCPISLLCLC